MYNKIYQLCSQKSFGATRNGLDMPNRVRWIIKLLEDNSIEYEIDEWQLPEFKNNKFYILFYLDHLVNSLQLITIL